MQDRYVGDVGDFGKYGLLRTLCRDVSAARLGVVWYLVDREEDNNDGRHTGYLLRPQHERCTPRCECFRACDPALFDELRRIVVQRRRSLSAVEQSGVLPSKTVFFDEPLTSNLLPHRQRPGYRDEWFRRAVAKTQACDVVFLDPDNGLATPHVRTTQIRSDKYALPSEMQHFLDRGQAVILYHQLGRQRGGHRAAIADLVQRIHRELCAAPPAVPLWYRRGTSRVFLIVPATEDQARAFGESVSRMRRGRWWQHRHYVDF